MSQKTISEILSRAGRPLLSYEFFPPKDDAGMDMLRRVAEELRSTRPDFVTVTYGAGGSTRERTLQVCQHLASSGLTPIVHHLTCVGAGRDQLREVVDTIHATGLRNIMALRGDPPKGETRFVQHPDGLAHASDLVRFIKQRHTDICCGVAGYPETHQEALSPESDILYLKDKVDAGGSYITSQLFYDNEVFLSFRNKCQEQGIRAPIIPGLLPPISLPQLKRMAAMCKASIPEDLARQMENVADQPEASEAVGIAWTVKQIKDLLKHGVPGVHLYVLNRSKVALAPALKECFGR